MKTDPDISTCIAEDVGVGACKNELILQLSIAGCQHIFIVEDDVKIKRDDVLEAYIEAASEFGLHHMNFGHTYDSLVHHAFLNPFMTLKHNGKAIDIYRRLSGVFEYFTSDVIQEIGLMDERFVNALEHCEHTYRIAQAKLTTPFNAFADLSMSYQYLEDRGICTTIRKDELCRKRLSDAFSLFKQKHGITIQQTAKPTDQQIVDAIDELIERKNNALHSSSKQV